MAWVRRDRLLPSDRPAVLLPLTHEFLSQILGVRRAGVTEAALALQEAGCIRYQQGLIEVLDRKRLEEASCECYRIIAAEYERLIGPGWSVR